MQAPNRWAISFLVVSLLARAWVAHAQPYVTVTDDGYSFSPDPVNIVAGETVLWFDDGSGPYTISSFTDAWPPFLTPGEILFSQPGTYDYYDDVGDLGTVNVSANVAPSVVIINPTNNAVFAAPASFTFTADAFDPDADGLRHVRFYVESNLVDDLFNSPFTTSVTNLAAGNYTLTVIAYDNVGASTTNSITVVVQNSAPITLGALTVAAGHLQFTAAGLTPGKTNILQGSTDLSSPANWVSIETNTAIGTSASFTNASGGGNRFFRLLQMP